MKHIIKFLILIGFGYLWRKMGSKLLRGLISKVDSRESEEAYRIHGPDQG